MAKERRANKSADEIVSDLQGRIEAVKSRDARRKAKARPEIKLALVARKALEKAHAAAEDAALKTVLGDAHASVATVFDAASVLAHPVVLEARKRRGRTAESVNE